MPKDYAQAIWLPCKNFWPGGNAMTRIVVHGTASGGAQTGYQLATGAEFNDGQSASVTYINDIDGTVYQLMQESDCHWGNCCVYGVEAPAGYYPLPGTGNWHLRGLVVTGMPGAVNMNTSTIAIENVKHDALNNDPLTPAQYQSLVRLVADIATRRKIRPTKGSILGHFDLDAINKAHCPGTFDWSRFYRDVQLAMGYGPLPRATLVSNAQVAGFTGAHVDTAVAIALAESGGMPLRQGLVADGSLDRGLVQFNSHWHPEVSDSAAYDPAQAFKEMFRVSAGATFSDWTTYTSGAYRAFMPTGGTVILNSTGMVADIVQSNQLSENEMDLCGPWSVAALLYAGPPGKGPTGTAEHIDQWVDSAVGAMGYADPAAFPGVSIPDEEWLLQRSGLHYQEIASDVASIRLALAAGYPVIVTVYEPNVFSWSPAQSAWVRAYPWSVNANHVFPVGGVDRNGNLICADQLNNSFQGIWPPTYDAARLNPSYAAVVRLPFLAPIPSADPHTWPAGFNAQGGSTMPVPTGWKDDGTTLVAPNNMSVKYGFRNHIIAAPAWESFDWPLQAEVARNPIEESNAALGAGSRQVFRKHLLEYTTAKGVYEGFLGQEFLQVLGDRDAKAKALAAANASLATATSAAAALTKQVADLQAQQAASVAQIAADAAQIAALQNQVSAPPPPAFDAAPVQADLASAEANIASARSKLPS